MEAENKFYKINDGDKVWWLDTGEEVGTLAFSFDKEKVYYLFQDYPWALTKEEKLAFDIENPYWAYFFKDRE